MNLLTHAILFRNVKYFIMAGVFHCCVFVCVQGKKGLKGDQGDKV